MSAVDTSQYRYRVIDQPSLSILAYRSTREQAEEVVASIREANPGMPDDEVTIFDCEEEAPHHDSGSGGY